MADIRINKITLCNFKGIRDASFEFNGQNATLVGDNGTGKSTVFDAFIWLMFGKDSRNQDQTKFDIKTIDAQTGEPIHHAEHSVEAVLSVDGTEQTLKRVWRETWVKPRGEAVAVFGGHESAFFVNGVDVATKTAYDTVIHEWIDEGVFTMITNPLYFIDDTFTDWKARREVLLSLAGDEIDKSEIKTQFADLIATMNGEQLATFKKRIAAEKRENKKELAKCDPAIEAYKKAMPTAEDYNAIEREINDKRTAIDAVIATKRAEITEIDNRIANVNNADESVRREHDAIIADISRIKSSMQQLIDDAVLASNNANSARNTAINIAKNNVDSIDADIAREQRARDAKNADIEACKTKRATLKSEVDSLRKEYEEAKAKAFEYTPTTRCHACGQGLPADTVADAQRIAREHYESDRSAALNKLVADAKIRKETYSKLETLIEQYECELSAIDQQLSQFGQKRTDAVAVQRAAEAKPATTAEEAAEAVRKSAKYKQLADTVEVKQKTLDSYKGVDVSELTAKRAEIEKSITDVNDSFHTDTRELQSRLDTRKQRADIEKLIADEEAKERTMSEHVAMLERLECEAAAYTKADIASVEIPINNHFKIARWRMYEQTIDGEDKECCKVTFGGVPYESLNSAMRILVGIDVIRAFCTFYGVTAPVFIDNGESITTDTFDVDSQVIRLVVAKGQKLSLQNK